MKIINKYLCKNFLGPFFLTFFVALFVLLMQFVWKWVDELVGKGLEVSVMLKLLFFAAVSLSSMAFPLAVMLASLMTFGNMGERYEIVALKSAGISTRKMMTPLAILDRFHHHRFVFGFRSGNPSCDTETQNVIVRYSGTETRFEYRGGCLL